MPDLLDWLRENYPDSKITPQDNGRYVLMNSPMRYDRTPSLMVWLDKGNWRDLGGNHEEGFLDELCERTGKDVPKLDGAPAKKRTDEEKAEADTRKTKRAAQEWNYATPATSEHKYLKAKGITDTFGLRVNRKGQLVIPGVDLRTDAFRMIQTVDDHLNAEGKWHKEDVASPKGAGWYVGGERGEEHSPLVLAEGPATAATIKTMFPGMAVLCTFGSENIESDYGILRQRFPSREIIVASDSGTEDVAAKCKGALPVIPSASQSNVDWNDCVAELGPEEARRQFTQKLESARAKAPKKPSLRSLRSTLAPERGVKPEMIGGIFPRGGVSILAGQQGSGKSLLMQRFCSDVSLGGEILSGVCSYASPRKVVYFVGELPEATMNDRTRTTGWPFNADNFVLYNRIEASKIDVSLDLTDAAGFKNIVAIIRDEKPDMVVFDSLMSFNTCDESDMKTMQEVFSKLVRLAGEEKVAVVLIHHIRKRKSVERQCRLHMDDIIGSSIITRNASVAVGVEAMKQDDGAESVYVSCLKTWYAPLDEFAFRIVRDESKVLRGIEIDLDPKSPAANKTEAIKKAVFTGHADGSEFTVAGIATLTGSTEGYVRRLFREWEEKGMIESRGGSKNTSYNIMQKYRNHIQTLANTEKDSGTSVPESTGILISPERDSGTDSGIPVLPVPESFPVIPTAGDPFRYKPMIPGTSKGNLSFLYAEREPEHLFPRDSVFGDVGSGENNAEAPKIEQSSIPRGASAPGPLVEVESFPDEMPLPYEWPGHGWIVSVTRTGNGERSFVIAKSRDGKPVCSLREPKRVAP